MPKNTRCQQYWHGQQRNGTTLLQSDPDSSDSDALSESTEEAGEDSDLFFPQLVIGPAINEERDPEPFCLGIDPSGDALGDYDDMEEEDMMNTDLCSEGSDWGDLEETDDEMDLEFDVVGQILEPPRETQSTPATWMPEHEDLEQDALLRQEGHRRAQAEQQMLDTPHVERFPGAAGQPLGASDTLFITN